MSKLRTHGYAAAGFSLCGRSLIPAARLVRDLELVDCIACRRVGQERQDREDRMRSAPIAPPEACPPLVVPSLRSGRRNRTGGPMSAKTSPREREVLATLNNHGPLTRSQLADTMGIDGGSLGNVLACLRFKLELIEYGGCRAPKLATIYRLSRAGERFCLKWRL